MKRWLFLGGFVLAGFAWGGDHSGLGQDLATQAYRHVDQGYTVKFSTTIPADTTVMLVGTMTANSFILGNGINYSSGTGVFNYTSSTTVTFGGREYFTVFCTSCTQKVFFDFSSTDISTNTSRWITDGQSYSPDGPQVWQGPIFARSTMTARLTGYFFMGRKR